MKVVLSRKGFDSSNGGIVSPIFEDGTMISFPKGESISVPPIGAMNDLPSSVTGINKHNDLSERVQERSTKKTE